MIVALAIPGNIAKLNDGRRYQLWDGQIGRTEYAMLELARHHVSPGYAPFHDSAELRVGPAPVVGLYAGDYLTWAKRRGSIAYSLDQIRHHDEQLRQVADVVLADALELKLHPANAPPRPRHCRRVDPRPRVRAAADVPRGGAFLRSVDGQPVKLEVRRFARTPPNARLGDLPAHGWTALRIPVDSASDPWQALADVAIEVCPLRD